MNLMLSWQQRVHQKAYNFYSKKKEESCPKLGEEFMPTSEEFVNAIDLEAVTNEPITKKPKARHCCLFNTLGELYAWSDRFQTLVASYSRWTCRCWWSCRFSGTTTSTIPRISPIRNPTTLRTPRFFAKVKLYAVNVMHSQSFKFCFHGRPRIALYYIAHSESELKGKNILK